VGQLLSYASFKNYRNQILDEDKKEGSFMSGVE
jgi:hypothetical protein